MTQSSFNLSINERNFSREQNSKIIAGQLQTPKATLLGISDVFSRLPLDISLRNPANR